MTSPDREAIDRMARRCDEMLAEYQERAASRWYNLPLPRRWHRCTAVYSATADGRDVDRCACGGIRIDGGRWMERNSGRQS